MQKFPWISYLILCLLMKSKISSHFVEATIGGNAYQHNKVNQWTSNVVEQCLNQLTKLNKPFKYIVNCVIMQKNGAGMLLSLVL